MTASTAGIVCFDRVTGGWTEGSPVVRNLTAQFERVGVTILAGPNGTGKSTLAELISGYLRPWEGTVQIDGLPAHSPLARERRRICRTAPALFGLMTVRDHLVLSARSAGGDVARQLARAEAMGLGPWLAENAGTLSSGTAKKLWYLFCTAGDFDLTVLDEPFNALDAAAVDAVLEEVGGWARSRCVVLIAHQPPVGLAADHTFVLSPWAVRGV
ncbi:MAG: ATP-binding cassette domain-containing protein [Bifidobacteriaceae bacterium]|jgi:ABC-type multidrug transport system ATPase subunit|nr:ATP-binding cassette domain-containing protein [Bifidobacteriaceae bacterium]